MELVKDRLAFLSLIPRLPGPMGVGRGKNLSSVKKNSIVVGDTDNSGDVGVGRRTR